MMAMKRAGSWIIYQILQTSNYSAVFLHFKPKTKCLKNVYSVSDDEAKVTKEMQGVSEEKALKSLLTSDEDEDEDAEKKEENKDEQNNTDVEEEDKTKKEENKPKQSSPNKKKKKNTDKKSKKESGKQILK